MFKCKQCGRAFSANLPDTCPDCGVANRQPDSAGSSRFWAFLLIGGLAELLILAVLVGIVIALAIKYL
jgi:ABC-type ATPase with predicted acetyltransferase domain